MAGASEARTIAAIGEMLARERRARLSAERRLVSMQAELLRANAALDAHARWLAGQIGPLRREAETLRDEIGRAATHRQIAERRLWDAIEAIPDGFAIYDAGLSLVAANATYLKPFEGLEEVGTGVAYRRMLELAAAEGVVDIGMLRAEAWVASMEARLSEDRPEPVVLRLWDGTCVRLLHHRAASGDLVSLVLDVTAAMEREAELEEARYRAEAASRAKSAFLANMSHELRTPLGGILGVSQLLAEEDLTEDQRVQVEVIQDSGEALLSIVDDVLDLGRIEGARMALRPAPFAPREVIAEVVRMLRPTAMERGLEVEVDVDAGLPERLVGDGGRVRQILTNLVGNAVKFTPTGRVTIRVIGAGWPGPGVVRLHVSVEDTGIGIAEADLERMFGAFEQAESGHDRRHDGAGLGLAVTRRLIDLMGGEVWADSAPGTGSCFGFRVDLAVAGEVRGGRPGSDPAPGRERAAEVDGSVARGALAPREENREGEGGRGMTERDATIDVLTRERRREGRDSPSSARPSDGPAPAHGAGNAPRMRVLAAEDNRANRLILERMLRGLDIDLVVADDGFEAVAEAERDRPDLILMDVSMPGMDGREATRRIRAREGVSGRVPIIAVTAHAMPGGEAAVREAGFDGFCPKPLRKEAIRELVTRHAPPGVRPPDGGSPD